MSTSITSGRAAAATAVLAAAAVSAAWLLAPTVQAATAPQTLADVAEQCAEAGPGLVGVATVDRELRDANVSVELPDCVIHLASGSDVTLNRGASSTCTTANRPSAPPGSGCRTALSTTTDCSSTSSIPTTPSVRRVSGSPPSVASRSGLRARGTAATPGAASRSSARPCTPRVPTQPSPSARPTRTGQWT